jgi:hypothetical protein
VRRCALAVFALLALASSAAAATPRHTPAGFRRHDLGAGVSLALPVGWQVVGHRDAGSPGVLQALRRIDPSFAASVSALAQPDSPLKLFAFDRAFWHHRPTTAMFLQATTSKPGPFRRWSATMAAQLRHAPGRVGPVAQERLELPAGTALRARYRTSTDDTVTVYAWAGREGVWALVFRAPTPHSAAVEPLFRRAAATLVLPRPPTSKPGA